MKTAFASTRSQHSADQRSPYVVDLASANDIRLCGGKACSLGKLIRLGIRVPAGFVVTDSAFQEFLDHNDLRELIADQLAERTATDGQKLRAASERIRAMIVESQIPPHIWDVILSAREQWLPGRSVAVRSSAIGEDSHDAAFAGQLDSFLDVQSECSLRQSLLACWASYWSHRSMSYQLSRKVRLEGMGVVIQRLVSSRISGVLFTRHPQPEADDENSLIAEYCFGFGESLVSGKINPGRFSIDRNSLRCRMLSTPETDADSARVSGVQEGEGGLLGPAQINRLAQTGLAIEDAFGCPQDIEWAIDDDGEVHLVQSRPITTCIEPVPRRKNTSHGSPTALWTNANVNENFPEPITPLLYSIAAKGYYHYFRNLGVAVGLAAGRVEAMEHALRNIIGVHGARMYYNLSSIHACLRVAPCGDVLIQWFNHFVGAAQVARTDELASWNKFPRGRLATAVELIRIAFRAAGRIAFLSKGIADFEKTADAFARETAPDLLEHRSTSELLANLRAFMHLRCHGWKNASFADAASMISYGMLKRFLNREFPERDMSSLHNSLLKGLRDIISGAPIDELWKLSRMICDNADLDRLFAEKQPSEVLAEIRTQTKFAQFRKAFDDYLDEWGFRCSGELMLTVPSYQEEPESLISVLRAYRHADDESPSVRLQRQESQRIDETKRVMRELRSTNRVIPRVDKSVWASILLRSAHKSIALRERARLKQALLYNRCRRIAIAIGKQLVHDGFLDSADDVFFLTYEELDALLAGSAMFPHQTKQLVALRRAAHEQLSTMKPPDSFELGEGCYLRDDEPSPSAAARSSSAGDSTELMGTGACGGNVTAKAAILKDMTECHLLSKGDILVARQTDPGWGPVFFLIKGLILERGGMLSHGAILAREFGIPTVVGVPDATLRITHGQTVHVNGDRGVVRLTHE